VTRRLYGHTEHVTSVRWSADGRYILSSAIDGTIRITDAVFGHARDVILVGRDFAVMSVAWSPDGGQFVYGYPDGSLKVHTLECQLTIRTGAALRSTPSESGSSVGSAAVNQTLTANGFFPSIDGFRWWRLVTGDWI